MMKATLECSAINLQLTFCLQILDVGDLVVMPGIIDPHVHIYEPGQPAGEGFTSVTQAAAAGGITTVVDMPLYVTRGLEGGNKGRE